MPKNEENARLVSVAKAVSLELKEDGDFVLLQLNQDIPEASRYLYMSMAFLAEHDMKMQFEFYQIAYSGNLESINCHSFQDLDYILEHMYYVFNEKKPDDYHCNSMSISDIVMIRKGNDFVMKYCDTFGFADLRELLAQWKAGNFNDSIIPYVGETRKKVSEMSDTALINCVRACVKGNCEDCMLNVEKHQHTCHMVIVDEMVNRFENIVNEGET